MSLKEKLGALKLAVKELAIPELGETVYIHEMTGLERGAWESAWQKCKTEGMQAYRAMLLIHTVRDSDGKPLFTEADIEWLASKSGRIQDMLFVWAGKLNGIGYRAEEEIEKN